VDDRGYAHNSEHLQDELGRVEHLLRAEIAALRQDAGQLDTGSDGEQAGVTSTADPGREHREIARSLAEIHEDRVRHSQVPLRLPTLLERFGLDDRERDVVLLCLLAEVDPGSHDLFEQLGSDGPPTATIALRVLTPERIGTPEMWTLFAAGQPLLRNELIIVEPTGELHLDPVVARFLLGADATPDNLHEIISSPEAVSLDDLVLAPELRKTFSDLASWLSTHDDRVMVLLNGGRGVGRRTLAAALCGDADRPLLYVDTRRAKREDWYQTVRQCYREARLRGAALCWAGVDIVSHAESADHWTALLAEANRFPGLTFFLTTDQDHQPGDLSDGRCLHIDLPTPAFPERRRLWRTMLSSDAPTTTFNGRRNVVEERLANAFRLTPGQIRDAIGAGQSVARLRDPTQPVLSLGDLFEGCRRQAGRRLVSCARRVDTRTELTLDDVVLSAASRQQLHELATRIALHGTVFEERGFQQRVGLGRGVVAMFTGGAGTGKTLTAELLAKNQGIDLYKVDISAVASRWLGEMEKNMDRVFADAEQANAMLFFDEADALFGKRGEVKEARDRWANMEMSFLLQRIEEFNGVVILATNLGQNIDKAFFRRVQAVVDFPVPDAEQRLRIWRGLFPAGLAAPPDHELAEVAERFHLTGGVIRNAVVSAAFRTLHADATATAVPVRDLVISIGREYQKSGLPITPSEFGEPFHAWVTEAIFAN
jgi:AAA+ superfamily predicted ATPase